MKETQGTLESKKNYESGYKFPIKLTKPCCFVFAFNLEHTGPFYPTTMTKES